MQRRNAVKSRTIKWGGLAAVVVIVLFAVSRLDSGSSGSSTDTTVASSSSSSSSADTTSLTTLPGESVTGNTPCPKTDGSVKRTTMFEKAPPMCIDAAKTYTATFDTSEGTVEVALDTKKTPNTVNNFVGLARQGYYDGLTFHRVVPGFVIQGGCPEGSGRGGPGYKFEDEPVQGEYTLGAVAMANAGPNTNGSQFFICIADNRSLPKQYNLFGTVEAGMHVALETKQGDTMATVVIEEIDR